MPKKRKTLQNVAIEDEHTTLASFRVSFPAPLNFSFFGENVLNETYRVGAKRANKKTNELWGISTQIWLKCIKNGFNLPFAIKVLNAERLGIYNLKGWVKRNAMPRDLVEKYAPSTVPRFVSRPVTGNLELREVAIRLLFFKHVNPFFLLPKTTIKMMFAEPEKFKQIFYEMAENCVKLSMKIATYTATLNERNPQTVNVAISELREDGAFNVAINGTGLDAYFETLNVLAQIEERLRDFEAAFLAFFKISVDGKVTYKYVDAKYFKDCAADFTPNKMYLTETAHVRGKRLNVNDV